MSANVLLLDSGMAALNALQLASNYLLSSHSNDNMSWRFSPMHVKMIQAASELDVQTLLPARRLRMLAIVLNSSQSTS